jgi:hypothetical protein
LRGFLYSGVSQFPGKTAKPTGCNPSFSVAGFGHRTLPGVWEYEASGELPLAGETGTVHLPHFRREPTLALVAEFGEWILKAIIAIAALALGVCTASPEARAETPLICAAALTNDCLFTVLSDLGLAPKPLKKGYLVAVKRDAWTLYVQVVLSEDGTKLGLNAKLGGGVTAANVTAAQWEALMAANGDIDPSTFYYDPKSKQLFIHRSNDNRKLTAVILRGQLDTFLEQIISTANIWSPVAPY